MGNQKYESRIEKAHVDFKTLILHYLPVARSIVRAAAVDYHNNNYLYWK